MKVTVPHAGHLWVALHTLFERTGIEAIEPPPSTQRTVSLGVRYSPEWICFPFKVMLGNFIEAIELGADTIAMAEGPMLCRLGYFAKLYEQTLHDMGHTHVRVLAFNWQDEQVVGLAKFLRGILGEEYRWRDIVGFIWHGIQQVAVMESLEKRVQYLRPRARDFHQVERIWATAPQRIIAAHDGKALKAARRELEAELNAVPLDPRADPLRVHLLGEFFVVLDPFVNMDLEVELGKRGVHATRSRWIAEWAKIWLFLELIGLGHDKDVKQAARPYLSRDVSGEAIYTVGETVLRAQEGYDGIIHLQPFTCMPEIIAQNVLPQAIKNHDIPVLYLVIDEQMGKAGYMTRVEAFVDLMRRRRTRKRKEVAIA